MKEIKLTRGQFALVDDEDFEWLNQWKWFANKTSKDSHTFYALRNSNEKKRKAIYMHRLILGLKANELGDHIDGNGLNNQTSNLRKCNVFENRANQIKGVRNTSKFKGVCFLKDRKAWMANIQCDKKKYYLGYFKNESDAAKAYNIKALELFGQFAKINQI